MVFGLFKNSRRKRIIAEPFSRAWEEILQENFQHWHYLDPNSHQHLCDLIKVFIAEKDWEFCGGLEPSEEIKVTIAAQACLLLMNIEHDYYRNVGSILMYPSTFFVEKEQVGEDGFVISSPSARLGEAHLYGPVVLAWDAARHGGLHPTDGHNVVYHEFAHKLDMLDGSANGTPELDSRAAYRRWHQVMTHEYEKLIDDSDHGRATLLDDYGCTNEAEFFAVAVECFFDKPRRMKRKHPDLYDVLADYFKQDPASWTKRQR